MTDIITFARLSTAVLTGATLLAAQVSPLDIRRSIQIRDLPPPSGSSPDRWVHGYLPMFTRTTSGTPPEVWMYDREGRTVIPKHTVWLPDVYHVAIHGAAPSPEGGLIVSAEVWERNGLHGVSMLGEMTAAGSFKWISPTAAMADHLHVTHGGAILAAGGPLLDRLDRAASFDLLSRYHRDGRLEGTSIPFRASPQNHYMTFQWDLYLLTAANGAGSFYNGITGDWIEFDANGRTTSQQKIPIPVSRPDGKPYRIFNIVMTSTRGVYAWLYAPSGDAQDRGIFVLDRKKGQWLKSPRALPQGYGGIYGVDGNSLITRSGDSTYAWFDPPE